MSELTVFSKQFHLKHVLDSNLQQSGCKMLNILHKTMYKVGKYIAKMHDPLPEKYQTFWGELLFTHESWQCKKTMTVGMELA